MKSRHVQLAIKEECGAGTIIEYTIVFPIVLAVCMALILMGYTVHERAVLEGATARTALYAAKTMADQNYETITGTSAESDSLEITDIAITEGSIETAPYRFLLGGVGSTENCEDYCTKLIRKNQLFMTSTPTVSVKKSGVVFTKVTVTAKQEFKVPVFPMLDLPSVVDIESTSTAYVNEPAEFIRNADLAIDVVKAIDEKVGISEKISELGSKFKNFFTAFN